MRPSELAQDLSPDVDVFRHALEWLRDHDGYHCDLVVHLRPTAPVRRVALVDRAIETMVARRDADSLRSVSRPEQSPYKMWRIVDGRLEPLLQIASRAEAHSLPAARTARVYWQNGYVDIVRGRTPCWTSGMMAGRRIVPFIVRDRFRSSTTPTTFPGSRPR
jgi:N-acylneuraminate cytidylyltransferase